MKDAIVFDSEVFESHYLFAAKRLSDGKRIALWGDIEEDMARLNGLLHNPNLLWIGFNSNDFDIPIALRAAQGATTAELKAMANDIIGNKKRQWMALRDYGLALPEQLDTIDLFEVAPGVITSLKLYDARMNSPSIIDLPFHHTEFLSDEQAVVLHQYCNNDLDATERLYNALHEEVAMREMLSQEFGFDARSKSDAQIAETHLAGRQRVQIDVPPSIAYKAPTFLFTEDTPVAEIQAKLENHRFIVEPNGKIVLPEFLNEPVKIGEGTYQMGIGGLHSTHDLSVSYYANGTDIEIVDADIASFYPYLILNGGLIPRNMGQVFIDRFRSMLNWRLKGKADAAHFGSLKEIGPTEKLLLDRAKAINAGGKIMVNGTFGKLGSIYSKVYAPDLMLATTLTGQLYLLTLIYHLENIRVDGRTIRVVSANTDGITFYGGPDQVKRAKNFIKFYGEESGFEFEFVNYRSIHYKDCNNYIAVKEDGKTKAKGLYTKPEGTAALMKNPTNTVCSLAAAAFLAQGVKPADYICNRCRPEYIHEFMRVVSVNGGAIAYGDSEIQDRWRQATVAEAKMRYPKKDFTENGDGTVRGLWVVPGKGINGEGDKYAERVSRPAPYEVGINPTPLGRVVRWYYSTDPKMQFGIRRVESGNLVPNSTGGRAAMQMPTVVPSDLDIDRYIEEAVGHLRDMGIQGGFN